MATLSLRDAILPAIDAIRGIPSALGIRLYDVSIRVVTWTGARAGLGTSTTVDTSLTNAGRRPKVVLLKDKDVVAGAVLTRSRYQVRNITPAYSGGGVSTATLDPPAVAGTTQLFYVLKGPGMPATGMLCQKVSDDFDRALGYSVVVETLGKAA